MSGPNFDARMIQYAEQRGQVAVTRGDETRVGTLHAWRPFRIGHGRRYSARVDFGHGVQSVNLNRYAVVPA